MLDLTASDDCIDTSWFAFLFEDLLPSLPSTSVEEESASSNE
jgi:hypothetical protein